MAKIIDYPRASLDNAMQLAEAVDSLGGSAKIAMAAEKMGRKVSGAFSAVVSAAVKYSLISSKEGRLSTTPVFRDIKLAYSEEEKRRHIRKALLSPPIFEAISKRFGGRELPIDHFDRLLIREFNVSDDIAPRVAAYFIDGARQAGLLNPDNSLGDSFGSMHESGEEEDKETFDSTPAASKDAPEEAGSYSVTFRGPGLSSTVTLSDESDLAIVEAMLKKISKAINVKQ